MGPEKFAFPIDCPSCKASSAYPYEAQTIRGNTAMVRLGLRCRQCSYEWQLDLDTDPIAGPGPSSEDRRPL